MSRCIDDTFSEISTALLSNWTCFAKALVFLFCYFAALYTVAAAGVMFIVVVVVVDAVVCYQPPFSLAVKHIQPTIGLVALSHTVSNLVWRRRRCLLLEYQQRQRQSHALFYGIISHLHINYTIYLYFALGGYKCVVLMYYGAPGGFNGTWCTRTRMYEPLAHKNSNIRIGDWYY